MIYRLFVGVFCISLLLYGCTRVSDLFEEPISTTLSGVVNGGRYLSPSRAFSLGIPTTTGNLVTTDVFDEPGYLPNEGQVYFNEVTEKSKRRTIVNFTPADPSIFYEYLPSVRELTPELDQMLQQLQEASDFTVLTKEFVSWNGNEQYLMTARSTCDSQKPCVVAWLICAGRYPKGSLCILVNDMPMIPPQLGDIDSNSCYWDELKEYTRNLFLSFR
jgi:hypothetical protein